MDASFLLYYSHERVRISSMMYEELVHLQAFASALGFCFPMDLPNYQMKIVIKISSIVFILDSSKVYPGKIKWWFIRRQQDIASH